MYTNRKPWKDNTLDPTWNWTSNEQGWIERTPVFVDRLDRKPAWYLWGKRGGARQRGAARKVPRNVWVAASVVSSTRIVDRLKRLVFCLLGLRVALSIVAARDDRALLRHCFDTSLKLLRRLEKGAEEEVVNAST